MKANAALIDAEHAALDSITLALEAPTNRRGLTFRQIADATGLAIGRVEAVCRKSEIVLKRRSHNADLWWNDWRDVEDAKRLYKPARKAGRPKTKK